MLCLFYACFVQHVTLAISFKESCAQVHPAGLRHIRSDRRINEWRAPGRRTITHAATNARQVQFGWDMMFLYASR